MTAISVLVVDDQAVIRTGLSTMIDAEPDLDVIGQAADGATAIELAARLHPDVVLMDIRMPGIDGITATRTITGTGSAGAVVIVTTFDDEEYLLEAVRAGAFGFLLKDAGPDLIAAGVRTAHNGDTLIDPSMTAALLQHRLLNDTDRAGTLRAGSGESPSRASARDRVAVLSPREQEVLAAVARGASNAQIAQELWVSESTIKTHIRSIFNKTGTTSRLHAAVLAYESGFVEPGRRAHDA